MIVGLRIKLHEVGNSFAITDADFKRLSVFLKNTKYPTGRGGRPKQQAMTA